MATDWIKMRTDLYRDPRVIVMADELLGVNAELSRYVRQHCQRDMTVTRNVTRNAVVGALVSVWGVMRQRGKRVDDDLICRNITLPVLDDIADLPGFGVAMAESGWAMEVDGNVVFPRFFEEYNADPSDQKPSAAAERQRRYRENLKGKSDVTRDANANVTRDVTVTPREEKRREEEKERKKEDGGKNPPPAGDDLPPLRLVGDDDAPPAPKPRTKNPAFDAAIAIIGDASLVGKKIRDCGAETVQWAVGETLAQGPADPKSYLLKLLTPDPTRVGRVDRGGFKLDAFGRRTAERGVVV